MERQDVKATGRKPLQPASEKTRDLSYLLPDQAHLQPFEKVRVLAREVLAICQHMRKQNMSFVCMLNNTAPHPDMMLNTSHVDADFRELAHDLINDLNRLPENR